ncbi:MAG: gliding motility-associated C-terminal domain-containing protein, partial [Saprospiraceae bacterium]|nr:gliding motility-associated C-terminal domain-containing protein [Saprospiraceae bacterium]
WTDPAGNVIPSNELEVSEPGTYTLEILNTNTGCSAVDEMVITNDGQTAPEVAIATPSPITCTNTFATLTSTVTPNGGTYQYLWSVVGGGGNIIGPTDQAVTQVNAAGIYQVSVTDTNNGCFDIVEVTVVTDTIAPVANASNPTPALVITCATPSVTMGGDGTSVGADYTYQWTTVANSGATLPTPNNIFLAEATSAGSYILTVRDVTNGCLSRDTAVITADTISPVIPNVMAEKITCDVTSVTLDASATTPNTGITILWTGTNGAPSPTDQLITTATVAGTYTLTVRNNTNGCETSKDVEVGINQDPPTISIATPPLFSCAFPSVVVNASATGPVANFSSITWSTQDGGTITPPSGALSITVSAPGTYELTVVRADNGCTATGSATVSPANDTPVADAGPDFNIDCGEMTVLDGSGSTAGNYQWTNISGGAAPNPATAQNPAIDAPGTYRLLVTNPANNCMDADTVVVTLVNTLGNANAGPDQDLCGDMTTLNANLPAGATGLWTSVSSAVIATPDQGTTDVTNLRNGSTTFVWTLSAPGCVNYSADTVIVVSSGKPEANNDVLNIGADTRSGSVNVTSNEVLTGITNFEATLLGTPSFGVIDSFANNTLYFSVGIGAEGSAELTYQICNLDCPGQCDTAIIVINVEDDGKEPELPNTITPNGDGMNEALVFDVLLSNPAEEFPNNELIVFNRWGDIVYQAKPYTNNWQGTNSDGEELPHGTYYYILRLNIGNREIIRGDVTIVK